MTSISSKRLRYQSDIRSAPPSLPRGRGDVAGESIQHSQLGPSGWGIVAMRLSFATAELSQEANDHRGLLCFAHHPSRICTCFPQLSALPAGEADGSGAS